MCFWFNIKNKGIRREKHDMTAACPQGKVEQEYIKSRHGLMYQITKF